MLHKKASQTKRAVVAAEGCEEDEERQPETYEEAGEGRQVEGAGGRQGEGEPQHVVVVEGAVDERQPDPVHGHKAGAAARQQRGVLQGHGHAVAHEGDGRAASTATGATVTASSTGTTTTTSSSSSSTTTTTTTFTTTTTTWDGA